MSTTNTIVLRPRFKIELPFNNETVYVAFRHHDVTDMFSLNIKDISVSEILQEFVEHDISSSNYQVVDAEGGTGTFDFTVTSFGTDNLSEYDFNYTINGSPSSIASNQILSVGGQESFSFDSGPLLDSKTLNHSSELSYSYCMDHHLHHSDTP
mgnify:CR=1 FL=1